MMQNSNSGERRVGVAIVGVGGAVATTAIAGAAMISKGLAGKDGLPLADLDIPGSEMLVPYENLVFGGWDLSDESLSEAAIQHGVMDKAQVFAVKDELDAVKPWPAAGNPEFCRNVEGSNVVVAEGYREQIAHITSDLSDFRRDNDLDSVVLVNLASTERVVDTTNEVFASVEAFERGLDDEEEAISPAMIYAYAAIISGVPYVNFTPSAAADIPALKELAGRENVPVCGRDGKTGQTMVKTVLAPAFKTRNIKVEGWFSTNILGNRDGMILDDPDSLASKVTTKGSVLDEMLGYPVEDHIVSIHYYKPRGDDKEAWDNIDLVGFMGRRMQMKVNFLCSDSVLAAPLAIELVRLSDLASQRGEGGVQEQFGVFFKAPMMKNGDAPRHAFHEQERELLGWISAQ